MTDPMTDECRRVREKIVERSGGFEGYFDQLEELDRQRLARIDTAQQPVKPSSQASKQRNPKPAP